MRRNSLPFAALTGHDDAIKETARYTSEVEEVDDDTADILNKKISDLISNINDQPVITVTYFVEDSKKAGGEYQTYRGNVVKIDDTEHQIIFSDNKKISISKIKDIDCEFY